MTVSDDEILNAASDAGAVAAVAREAGQPHDLDQLASVVGLLVPDGASHKTIDLERYEPRPQRKRGTVVFHDAASLGDYVTTHRIAGTAVYADVRDGEVVAVVNGHQPQPEAVTDEHSGFPGWGDHRAQLDLRHSHEYKAWTARNGKLTGQVDFAEFLEDNYLDIVNPDHATMLEIAQSIEATSNGVFKSKQRLTDGQVALRYEETVDARAGQKGDLQIPETFQVALRVFEGTDPVTLDARLRYRIRDGQLAIGYKLERLDDVVEKAFADVVVGVEERIGEKCWYGAAPEPVRAGR
jgi:uncharacterized protein YfdQ (DUF2303 family)